MKICLRNLLRWRWSSSNEFLFFIIAIATLSLSLMALGIMTIPNIDHQMTFGSTNPFLSKNDHTSVEGDRSDSRAESLKVASHSPCRERSAPRSGEDRRDFQPLPAPHGKLPAYVYSAYLDHQTGQGAVVRVLAISPRPVTRYMCQVWCRDDLGRTTMVTVQSTNRIIVGGHDLSHQYSSVYIMCQLKPSDGSPVAVSLARTECEVANNSLLVHGRVGVMTPVRYTFTVCVKPFAYAYDNVHQLVEFLELSRLLGAKRFVFYNYSASRRVVNIIHHYAKQGLAELLPWRLPVRTRTWPPTSGSQLHAFGQLLSSNDCLFRYRHLSRFQVFVDLDEFIVPLRPSHQTWHHIVEERQKATGKYTSVFLISNLFIRKDWTKPGDSSIKSSKSLSDFDVSLGERYHSEVLRHTVREQEPLGPRFRSKFIVDPRHVSMVDIHQARDDTGDLDIVPADVALLFHYRDWEAPNSLEPRASEKRLVDKYGKRLVTRLDKVWRELGSIKSFSLV